MKKVVIKGISSTDTYICEGLYFHKEDRCITLYMTNPMARSRPKDITVYLGANDQVVVSNVLRKSPSVNEKEV